MTDAPMLIVCLSLFALGGLAVCLIEQWDQEVHGR